VTYEKFHFFYYECEHASMQSEHYSELSSLTSRGEARPGCVVGVQVWGLASRIFFLNPTFKSTNFDAFLHYQEIGTGTS